MKKLCALLLATLFLFPVFLHQVSAQEGTENETVSEIEEQIFAPTILSDGSVGIGKNIIFAVDTGVIPEGAEVKKYLWEFGDGTFSSKEEVVHIFRKPGRYNVKLKVTWQPPEAKEQEVVEYVKEVFVYERSFLLATDRAQNAERLEALQKHAEDQNVYLKTVQGVANFRLRNQFLKRIEQELEVLQSSDTVILWSDRVDLLTILNSFVQRVNFQQKTLVVITDGNISLLKNVLGGVQSVVSPQRIIVTRREAIDEFFTTETDQDVVDVIRSRGYDFDVLTAESFAEVDLFSLPSYGMNYLQEHGVEDSVILLVLFLPVIVTLVTFLRLVIGLASIGARLPIIFTYSFLVLGWPLGIAIVFLLALISYLFRILLFRRHLLYTAKVGILTSFLGVVLLLVIGAVTYFELAMFDFTSALVVVILATIIDRVGSVEAEKGLWPVLRIFLETLIIASSAYLLVSWDSLQVLLIARPEILILFIAANVFMGRFTGLRLLEYFRFREILRYTEE